MTMHEQAEQLDFRVAQYAAAHSLPARVFQSPESLRVRANTPSYFTRLEEYYAGVSRRMAVLQQGWRFLAVAKLKDTEGVALPHFGQVNWLEIEEPSARQTKAEQGGVVSIRFFYFDLEELNTIMNVKRVSRERNDNGIVVPIRGTPQTIEFTDAGADEVLAHQIQTRQAIEVKLDD